LNIGEGEDKNWQMNWDFTKFEEKQIGVDLQASDKYQKK